MTGPSVPGLRARLTDAITALAEFREADEQAAANPFAARPDYRSWCFRLAAVLHGAAAGLRGALAMLDDADDVLTGQDATMVIGTGGLSVSVADAPVVVAALADAADLLRHRADQWCEPCQASASGACDSCTADLDAADTYGALTARLGGAR